MDVWRLAARGAGLTVAVTNGLCRGADWVVDMVVLALPWLALCGLLVTCIYTARVALDPSLAAPAVQPAGVDPTVAEAQAYLTKVELRDVHVAEGTLSRRGVFGEVKNLGTRTLTEVQIRVFCLDANGQAVHEETFYPVLTNSWTSSQPLRPNYARKFGYSMDDAPSEWSGKIQATVMAVEFAGGW